MQGVIPLSEAWREKAAGIKAQTLSLLAKAGLPVPLGFVIPGEAAGEVLRDAIREACRLGASPPYVVRSSGTHEDGESFSFAGQYETVLNVTEPMLAEAVDRCRRSANTPRTDAYRAHRLPKEANVLPMAVLVQELIDADVAGVAFGRHPITGNGDVIILNSCFGLGDSVASGWTTPDLFILSKHSPEVLGAELGAKECKSVLAGIGTRLIDTLPDERNRFSLQQDQLLEIREAVMAAERLLGYHVDLEFAYLRGQLYVLQARPITT